MAETFYPIRAIRFYFTGLTQQEAAQALGLSEITVRREWRLARAWLRGEIQKALSA